jgi:hypothetical protein
MKNTDYDTYNWKQLIDVMELRPITNKKLHYEACNILKRLAKIGNNKMSKDQSDYFDVLTDLVINYETKKWPVIG